MAQTTSSPQPQNLFRLFFISAAGLFLELLLIRWIGTEVAIFAYLQNTVLVTCFVGLGVGCYASTRKLRLRWGLTWLLALVVILNISYTRTFFALVSLLLGNLGDFTTWETMSHEGSIFSSYGLLALAGTWFIMWCLFEIFVPVGQLLGRAFDECPKPLLAYSVNVLGSLLGVWLFVALGAASLPPLVWFLVLALLFMLAVAEDRVFVLVAMASCCTIFPLAGNRAESFCLKAVRDIEADFHELRWSPYQKLVLFDPKSPREPYGNYLITVNGSSYQGMLDLSDKRISSDPEYANHPMRGFSQYDIPLLLHEQPREFLVVGAGSGNDVAGGLRHGVEHITAVEIDPAIIDFGRRFHPEQPYSNAAVSVVTDDARAFFSRTMQKFDVISFGLLDSHTTTAMTNARLDHYVYTKESIEKAKSLLSEHGVMTLTFEAQKPYITDRMAGVLRAVFGREPLMFQIPIGMYGWGGVMFVSGDTTMIERQLRGNPRLQGLISTWQSEFQLKPSYSTNLTSDDWPYLYLPKPEIPPLFYFLAASSVLLLLTALWRLKLPAVFVGWNRAEWHFFFLGAAFLLLEVQNVSKASVALGNTWLVNAIIISAVLLMVLFANVVTIRWRDIPLNLMYAALIASTLGLYTVDWAWFAGLEFTLKCVSVGLLGTLPMLFSGIIFARSFAITAQRDFALGANLFGSLLGGLLQSLTFLTGIKALLLVVASLYLCAFVFRPATKE